VIVAECASRCLPVVALPLESECLGSWVGRTATDYGVSVSILLKSIQLPMPDHYLKNWLLLKPVNLSDSLIVAKACRRSQESIVTMLPSGWHLSHRCEFGMCARCLIEDHEKGRPVYWRRDWLDAVSVVCDRHASWLTPIDGDLFRRFNNWDGIEKLILQTAEHEIRGQKKYKILECLDKSSLFLQLLFKDETAHHIAESRYGLTGAASARQVAIDLLDALVHVNFTERRYSALHEYAWYLKIPFDNQSLTVNGNTTRQMSLRRIETLEARAFAVAVTDAIMFSRGRLRASQSTVHSTETQSFWMSSLWTFLPRCCIELLSQRAQNWPLMYVRTCWPELHISGDLIVLQSNKKALRSLVIRENMRTIWSTLANIRSN